MHRIARDSSTPLRLILVPALVAAGVALVGCGGGAPEPESTTQAEPAETLPPSLPGYAAMSVPADNPMTPEKVALGKQLYYDQRLSGDGAHSCYGCHLKEYGLATNDKLAIGAFDKTLARNIPTVWNVGFQDKWYWDGRAAALEGQVKGAWGGGNMGASGNDGAPSMEQVCANLMQIQGYADQFKAVFGDEGCTPDNVGKAVASFMRTIVSSDSPWIRFRNGDETALSADGKAGYELFSEKAKCTNCHDGLLLTDLQFHNVGIGCKGSTCADVGRQKVSTDEKDTGAFKTPTLIDVSKSAPYFHDGSVATLEEAVHLMATGGNANNYLDTKNMKDVIDAKLTSDDEAKLVAFLKEITANYAIEEPTLPQ